MITTTAILAVLSVIAAYQHWDKIPEYTAKSVKQTERQIKHDERLAEQARAREAAKATAMPTAEPTEAPTPEPTIEPEANPEPTATPFSEAQFEAEILQEKIARLDVNYRIQIHVIEERKEYILQGIRLCLLKARQDQMQKFTCEYKGTVLMYFEHYYENFIADKPLDPAWINEEFFVNFNGN